MTVVETKPYISLTPDRRISRLDAAAYIGVSTTTLDQWARENRFGLQAIKIGKRKVFYPFDQIEAVASGKICDDGSHVLNK